LQTLPSQKSEQSFIAMKASATTMATHTAAQGGQMLNALHRNPEASMPKKTTSHFVRHDSQLGRPAFPAAPPSIACRVWEAGLAQGAFGPMMISEARFASSMR
jgi:hypothetical protein